MTKSTHIVITVFASIVLALKCQLCDKKYYWLNLYLKKPFSAQFLSILFTLIYWNGGFTTTKVIAKRFGRR